MNIEIKDNEVHLVTDIVIESYRWFYHHSYKHKLNQIGRSQSFVSWFGNGTYICEINIDGQTHLIKADFSKNAEIDKVKYKLLPNKAKSKIAEWDMTLIPEDYIPLIDKFVKEDNTEELVIIHNRLKLSPIKLCCGNLSFVVTNFKSYLNDLQRGES